MEKIIGKCGCIDELFADIVKQIGKHVINRVICIAYEDACIIDKIPSRQCPFQINWVGGIDCEDSQMVETLSMEEIETLQNAKRWRDPDNKDKFEITITQLWFHSNKQMSDEQIVEMLRKAESAGLLTHSYSAHLMVIKLKIPQQDWLKKIDLKKIQLDHEMKQKQWTVMHDYATIQQRCRREYILSNFDNPTKMQISGDFDCCDICDKQVNSTKSISCEKN